jgi:CRP-like cAMP-binding protein
MEWDYIDNYHLKSSSFFSVLTTEEKEYVNSNSERKEFKKKQILFKEGSIAKGVYIIKKGKIKIYKMGADGKESIVYIYKKGDYFGYRPLLGGELNPVSAAALDKVVVNYIPKDIFLTLLNYSDMLPRNLLNTLSKEFSVWINKMTVFTQYSVKERVALSLLILSKIYRRNESNGKKVIISINRDDFAGFVGTAKESLVRTLRIFKDEKIISTSGTNITLLKPNLLFNYFR